MTANCVRCNDTGVIERQVELERFEEVACDCEVGQEAAAARLADDESRAEEGHFEMLERRQR